MTPLWLRSVRERPQTALLLCLLSALAVMTSVLGPILVRSVQQSTLSDALDAAGPGGRAISVSGQAETDEPWEPVKSSALEVVNTGRRGDAASWWSEPRVLVSSTTLVIWRAGPAAQGANAVVSAVDDDCRDYVLTAGRCPAKAGEVMLSRTETQRAGIRPGSTVTFTLAQAPVTKLKVVGSYDAVRSRPAGSQSC
jgi:putative ABC transport system permease protein